MKKPCCRSTPRCDTCPVRVAAAARMQPAGADPAALLTEILRGRPARQLPDSVAAALAELELAPTVR